MLDNEEVNHCLEVVCGAQDWVNILNDHASQESGVQCFLDNPQREDSSRSSDFLIFFQHVNASGKQPAKCCLPILWTRADDNQEKVGEPNERRHCINILVNEVNNDFQDDFNMTTLTQKSHDGHQVCHRLKQLVGIFWDEDVGRFPNNLQDEVAQELFESKNR